MSLFPRRVAHLDHASVKVTLRFPCDIARQNPGNASASRQASALRNDELDNASNTQVAREIIAGDFFVGHTSRCSEWRPAES
jgi:hypothetical protein